MNETNDPYWTSSIIALNTALCDLAMTSTTQFLKTKERRDVFEATNVSSVDTYNRGFLLVGQSDLLPTKLLSISCPHLICLSSKSKTHRRVEEHHSSSSTVWCSTFKGSESRAGVRRASIRCSSNQRLYWISIRARLWVWTMMHGFFKMGNVSCRIVSNTSLFMCKIHVPDMSWPYPCRSVHHRI